MSQIRTNSISLENLGSEYKVTVSYTVLFNPTEVRLDIPFVVTGALALRLVPIELEEPCFGEVPEWVVAPEGESERTSSFEVVWPINEVARVLYRRMATSDGLDLFCGDFDASFNFRADLDAASWSESQQPPPLSTILQKYNLSAFVQVHFNVNMVVGGCNGAGECAADAI
jgi:hypothetical protein